MADRARVHTVGRAADVQALLAHRTAVMKCPAHTLRAFPPGAARDHHAATMAFMDPPDHTRVRAALAHAFSPRALAALRPFVVATAATLADRLALRPRRDLVAGFAGPLPLLVIGRILGLSVAATRRLRTGAAAVTAALEPGADACTLIAGDRAAADLTRFLTDTPADSDGLVAQLRADASISAREALNQAIFVLNAGHETTAHAISCGAARLMAAPELRPGEEAGWAALAEEIVRLDPPLETLFRRTVALIDVGGAQLPAGSVLRFDLAAANRDPERFPAPDSVLPGRRGRQLGYAAGRHACLGAPLARLEIAVGLRELFARLPGLRPAGPPRFRRGVIFQSTTRQPVVTNAA